MSIYSLIYKLKVSMAYYIFGQSLATYIKRTAVEH